MTPETLQAMAEGIYNRTVFQPRNTSICLIVDAIRTVYNTALGEAAGVAEQSQKDCFCGTHLNPCGGCMEAARIQGTISGKKVK